MATNELLTSTHLTNGHTSNSHNNYPPFSMKKFVSRNFFPIFLIAISIVLCVANYTPGTILSGWDTLHPEFNFPEYLKRIFFGVWQSHQGLGALSTQAHASELPRMILYYPLSFILPLTFLRYLYFFLTLILGP